MEAVIYSFIVKPNHEEEFIQSWTELTQLFYKHAGSRGSRLHKESENIFIEYAQWPDIETYERASEKMPIFSKNISTRMRNACEQIETLHQISEVKDLIKSEAFTPK